MQGSIQELIDALYAAAQLVARDPEHAASLVQRVLAELESAESLDSDIVLSRLEYLAEHDRQGEQSFRRPETDLFASDRLRDRLDSILPSVFVRMDPARRLRLWKSVQNEQSDDEVIGVFLIAVRRRLQQEHDPSRVQCSESELRSALKRFFDQSLSPTPPSLLHVLEDRWELPAGGLDPAATHGKAVRLPWSARFAAAFLLILIAAVTGMWLSRPAEPETQAITVQNLLDVVAETRPSSDLILRGRDAAGLERFMADRLDRRIRIPEIDEARLSGMFLESLASGVEVPVLQFLDTDDSPILVWVLDYAVLERLSPGIVLDRGVLNQIAAEDAFDIRDSRNATLVVFRNRDDIYCAVTEGDGLAFRRRVSFPL